MNFRRVTTAQGLLYVGTETDGTPFEIYKRKDGQYDLSVGGEVAGSFARLMDAKAEASRIERQILDAAVARSKAAVEARGIRPGAVVAVKGRKDGTVTVKHVGAGYVELNRPTGGTFRRPAEDLTLVPETARGPVVFTDEEIAKVRTDIQEHNARAEAAYDKQKAEDDALEAEIDATEAVDAIRNRIEARPSVRKSGEFSIHVGDVVRLGHREGNWTVRRLYAHGRAQLEQIGGDEVATVPGHNIVEIVQSAHPQPSAAPVATEPELRTPEEIVSGGGVSLGDRVEVADNEGVWTVNQILEVEGEYLYRLYRTSGAPGNRQTWRLGEEITLLGDDEADEPATEALGEFSREEILTELHDSAVRFKPEQWPTSAPFPKEFGPAVVPNEEEGRKFRQVAEEIDRVAHSEVSALKPGDRIAYSGARGIEAWTVVGRRDQGGFVSIHVREESGQVRWWTVAELAVAVVDHRALLIPVVASEPGVPDEAGILRLVSDVLLETAPDFHADLASHVEDRQGQPVLVLVTRGGSYELYATRVR